MVNSINFVGTLDKMIKRVSLILLFSIAGFISVRAQYTLERLDDQINTSYDEIGPVVTPD